MLVSWKSKEEDAAQSGDRVQIWSRPFRSGSTRKYQRLKQHCEATAEEGDTTTKTDLRTELIDGYFQRDNYTGFLGPALVIERRPDDEGEE
jgi:hypothetical protein